MGVIRLIGLTNFVTAKTLAKGKSPLPGLEMVVSSTSYLLLIQYKTMTANLLGCSCILAVVLFVQRQVQHRAWTSPGYSKQPLLWP